MQKLFEAQKVTDRIYWVGAIDWPVRNFHGYLTSRGTTYNAYLVLADRIALIDTVKAPFRDEMLARIASVVPPAEIHTLISNHTEMDHTGCLPAVIDAVKPERVIASVMGEKALREHYHELGDIQAVKDGETVSLGNLNLSFVETRMLHWPDSMFTFLPEEGVLFSNDAFGMHLASSERFADEIDDSILVHEGAKYYANILLPLSTLVLKLFDKVGKMNLPIRIIAPDHGPIWRKDVTRILDLWAAWAKQERGTRAVVVYDTMWQSTAKMARAVADGLVAGGVTPTVMELGPTHRSDVATEILDAGAMVVGSPTINNNLFPTVADVLSYCKGLKPRGLVGAAFGSYGWSGEAVGQVMEILTAMKTETVGEGFRVKYVPDTEALARCRTLGEDVAKAVKTKQPESTPSS
ncbi:MAG: FprA family A-type flavoprotein [Planctomycetota bacterium]